MYRRCAYHKCIGDQTSDRTTVARNQPTIARSSDLRVGRCRGPESQKLDRRRAHNPALGPLQFLH